ncbi:hypothetical protein RFI_17601 [Reticulomyxa filosa]|uniref:Uncharacterized protein n=1 Tax=Reticulomyxa filosa TaxID=46433 RepID=X6N018_RETFI|nr:hypothetical protein RFI_17601 [Reticulomyxa filosa]|eukprot:ETO19630.1 hypothetical protein RFI_17601 [Reticulomyxa filosa]
MHEKDKIPLEKLEVYTINYTTDFMDGVPILKGRNYSHLDEVQYPKEIIDGVDGKQRWDFILVDGPLGHVHGRFQSIYLAYRLAKKTLHLDAVERKDYNSVVHIFVHDAERWIERYFSDVYPNSTAEGLMRYYQFNHTWLTTIEENERNGFAFPFCKEWK